MDTFLPRFIDDLLRRHPTLMWGCTIALAAIACCVLIGSGSSLLVYEGF